MQKLLKRNVLNLIVIGILLLIFEIVSSGYFAGLIGLGILFSIISIYLKNSPIRLILNFLTMILFTVVLLMTKSIWYFMVILLIFYYLSKPETGWRLLTLRDQSLHPFKKWSDTHYQGVSIIEPQSKQQSLLIKQPITKQYNRQRTEFPWEDINLVYFGGNNILDLGKTSLPKGEAVVLVRKVFGTLRIIVPSDVALSINFSAISASLIFDQEHYDITSENMRWESPNYEERERRVKLIVSTVVGDIEVFYV